MPFPRLICTLGTTTDDPSVLTDLVDAGMSMARLNTAYATLADLQTRLDAVNRTSIPVLLDLKGRQLRVDCTSTRTDPDTGALIERPCRYPIAVGDKIVVGFGVGPVRFNHDFEGDVGPGDVIAFDNGTIRARVLDPRAAGFEPVARALLLEVLVAGSGKMTPQMGANVPGRRLDVPNLTDRDRAALDLGVASGVAAYALSFVQAGADLEALHAALVERGDRTAVLVAKIEDDVGIDALEAIVAAGRALGREVAVMIARGDLLVEVGPVRLPGVQADLVRRCRALGAPSIVATGLLLSMTDAPVPTRAEVCDVASALGSGCASVMLSDETSNSRFPGEATRMLAALIAAYAC